MIDARFCKPLDEAMLRRTLRADHPVLTVEDHVTTGGFGAAVTEFAREASSTSRSSDSPTTRKLSETEAKLALAQAKTVTLNAPFRTQPGLSPIISEDKRATMATFGFFVGAGLPIAGFVLLGLLDRKYRYSDETNASSITRGIPLLGILPNLPDRRLRDGQLLMDSEITTGLAKFRTMKLIVLPK